jgi:hypothetical protein
MTTKELFPEFDELYTALAEFASAYTACYDDLENKDNCLKAKALGYRLRDLIGPKGIVCCLVPQSLRGAFEDVGM